MENKYDSTPDTLNHINKVGDFIGIILRELAERSMTHDHTKTLSPEVEIFNEFTPKLKTSTYGSEEYKGYLKEMSVALEHHYSNNRHHPEHFEDGISGMNLVDLIEMICDWKAATMRHNDGNIVKSIEINQKRFGYSDELKQIFLNTVNEYFADFKQ